MPRLTPSTLATLASHNWPGNVRELQNLIERAVIMTDGADLAFDPGWVVGASASETAKIWAAQERERLLDALRAANGRVYGPRWGRPPARAESDHYVRQDAEARDHPCRKWLDNFLSAR